MKMILDVLNPFNKKGLKKEASRSFVRKSNLDLMDSNPSLAKKDSEDLLSFSILNGFHSTAIAKTS